MCVCVCVFIKLVHFALYIHSLYILYIFYAHCRNDTFETSHNQSGSESEAGSEAGTASGSEYEESQSQSQSQSRDQAEYDNDIEYDEAPKSKLNVMSFAGVWLCNCVVV